MRQARKQIPGNKFLAIKLQCATRDARPTYDYEVPQKGWMEVEQAICGAVEARRGGWRLGKFGGVRVDGVAQRGTPLAFAEHSCKATV